MWGRSKGGWLGLDIGTTAIKLVELSRTPSSYRLDAYAIEPLPPGAVVGKAIVDIDVVAAAVKRALRQSGSPLRQVAMAIGTGHAITKTLSLPLGLNEVELEEQVGLEVEQYIDSPLEEVNFDFEVVGPAATGEHLEVLLAATRAEHVDSRLAVAELAGLGLKLVDIESYALENAYPCYRLQAERPQGGEATVAVVDLGHSATTLCVLRGGRGLYTHTQGGGGDALIAALHRHTGLEAAELLQQLRQGALPASAQGEVVAAFVQQLAAQVGRLLQLFMTSPQAVALERVLLAGGGSLLPGLPEAVGRLTQLPSARVQPLAGLALAPRTGVAGLPALAPLLVVALGLALRGCEP